MHKLAAVLALCATAALVGCATPPPPPPPAVQAAEDSGQICKREFPTFSAIAVTRCRSRAEVAGDRDKAAETATAIRDTARVLKDPALGR